jgi:hypothetical protein
MKRALGLVLLWGCSTGPNIQAQPIVAASPPRDDGKSAQGGSGGQEHAAALEELKVAELGPAVDRQNSVKVLLPDAPHWMRVKFWGIPTLVGFRYGQGHHAIVGGDIRHVPDNTVSGACAKSFEGWAMPLIEAYDIDMQRDAPTAFSWKRQSTDDAALIADIETLTAKGATLIEREEYAVAYATYPAWKGACLILGVAVPVRDNDMERARAVRDRFVKEVLPKVEVLVDDEPSKRF